MIFPYYAVVALLIVAVVVSLVDADMSSKREIEDEEIDINVDEDDDPFDKTFNAKSEKVSFSISNILSDNFGPKVVKIERNQNEKMLFEPNNTVSSKSIVQSPSSVFLSNFRLSEIFDYSTKHETFPQSISDRNLRSNLYNSLASYPKIQEEILNSYSHKKNIKTQETSNSHPTPSNAPPLGSLCRAVAQIGQKSLTQTAKASSSNTSQPKNTLSDFVKIQHTSTDSIDSDDCTSEASNSKDESQKMWPAWVNS